MAKLNTTLDLIDAESMLLPESQRGYGWNRGVRLGRLVERDGVVRAV